MSAIEIPVAIERYLQAEKDADWAALAASFLPQGVVLDEGRTHVGRDEIATWRADVAAKVSFTSTVTEAKPLGAEGFRLTQRIEGDFPGGVVELHFRFALRDDRIAALMILPRTS